MTMFETLTKIKSFPTWNCRYSSITLDCDQLRLEKEKLCYDVTIIGGGIIGTAIAREITEKSRSVKTLLIEKENVMGKHQSSHNSGIIHTGMYYKPESLKARLCSRGMDLILNYCKDNNIPHKTRGKLVVATNYSEIRPLKVLQERGFKNNVDVLKMLWTKEQIKEIEPKCNGIQALWSPKTSNVDWGLVTRRFAKDFKENGGDILLNNEINVITESGNGDYPLLIISKKNSIINTKYLILCGGLHSDKLSHLIEGKSNTNSRVVSFRVEYKLLETQSLNTNIYGVPDMKVPFLGVHIIPRLDGSVLLGPTAIPAYQVEGYSNEVNFSYLRDTIRSNAFQNMTRRYLFKCINQVKKTFSLDSQIKELQTLTDIPLNDIKEGPSAVQALNINEDGSFTDDFLFEFFEGDGIRKRIINCKFMPSPAATCSMSIAEFVGDKFFKKYLR